MVFHSPLDLEYWLISVVAGSIEIFIALALVGIVTVAAFFRMPNTITMVIISLFIIIMGIYMGQLLFVFIIILGLILGVLLAKAIKQ